MMGSRVKKYVLLVCLMVGMSFSLVYNLLYALRPDQSPQLILLTVVTFSILLLVMVANKKSLVLSILIGIVGGSLLSLYLYKQGTLFSVYRRIFFFIKSNELILGISFLVTLIVYFFTLKRYKWFVPVNVGVVACSLYIIQKMPFPRLGIEGFIFMSLCFFFYSDYQKRNLQIRQYIKSIGPLIGGVLGITCLCAYIVPMRFEFLHTMLDQKSYNLQTDRYQAYYPYTGRLGGNLTLNDREILNVMTTQPTYLRAGIKSIYTGEGWESPQEKVETFFLGEQEIRDTQEAVLGSTLLGRSVEELFERTSYRIRYEDIITRSLFIPSKIKNLAVSRNQYKIYCENEDIFLLDYPNSKGFVYVVQSYVPRYQNPIFEEAMKRSQPGLYKQAKEKGIDPFNGELDFFIQRADRIREQYTQLPNSVTDRVKALAEEITRSYKTPYEKVRAIEAYLARNYTYTLTPGEVSGYQDFVDEFLFEKKQGYCTYFATAMAVLTRCIGIPSRYVEGYVIPASEQEQSYRITSKEAHAWVEVYFEGIGWIMFEPTASYQNDLRDYTDIKQDEHDRNANQNGLMKSTSLKNGTKNDLIMVKKWYVVATSILIGGVLLGCLGVSIYQNQYRKRMTSKERICYFYNLGIQQLNRKGYRMLVGETEKMYAKRMDQQLGEDVLALTEYTKIYLKARYSLMDLSEKEVVMMKKFYKQCRKKSKFREKQNYSRL